MVLIPDPQTYTKFDYNHPTFELMMHWIKQNKRRLNIRLVFCTGDLVEQNQRTVPDGVNGNLPSDKQWQFVLGCVRHPRRRGTVHLVHR